MASRDTHLTFQGLEAYSLSHIKVTDQELGTGSYASVFKLDYLGLKCAGKKIHKILLGQESDPVTYTVRRFKDECQILSQVRHPNVVQFLGVFFQKSDSIPILVMEYLPMNLDQCLNGHNLVNEIKYSILFDVSLGLHYLHSQHSPIVHRDLSSNNVLLTSNMRAKISDLGVARILNLSPQMITHLTKAPGTPAFMPPEVMVAEPRYDTSVDIFSYGIVMIHVMSGKLPVPQIEPVRTEGNRMIPVSEAERRDPYLELIGRDHPLMGIIVECLHNNPEMRTNTSEIVRMLSGMVELHPMQFTSKVDMIEYICQLEERNEALEREKLSHKKSQNAAKMEDTREAISKLEKKQEDQLKMKKLMNTMEQAVDHLTTLFTGEVAKVLNDGVQSTSQDLDDLRQKMRELETSAASSLSQRKQRSYENTLPIYLHKQDSAKLRYVRAASDTFLTSTKQNFTSSKEAFQEDGQGDVSLSQENQQTVEIEKEDHSVSSKSNEVPDTITDDELISPLKLTEMKLSTMEPSLKTQKKGTHSSISNTEKRLDTKLAMQSSQCRPKSISVDSNSAEVDPLQITEIQRSKTGESKSSRQPKTMIEGSEMAAPGGTKLLSDKPAQMTERDSERGTDAAVSLVSASKGEAKKSPSSVVHKLQQWQKMLSTGQDGNVAASKKRELESTNARGSTVSKIIEQEEQSTSKDKDWVQSTHDTTATKADPKKRKGLKLKNLFSSRQKEERSKPVPELSTTELYESGSFGCSGSEYDCPLQGISNPEYVINKSPASLESANLVYPIYTARFDFEATSTSELSFRKGDQIYVKCKGEGKTWHGSLFANPEKDGDIPKSYVTALEDEEWFCGQMDANTAGNFVMTSSNELGSFLVRQNKMTGIFSLTIRDENKARHYHIYRSENGMLFASQACLFRSIYDLVQHHSQNADGLFTRLVKPCIVPHCITEHTEVTCNEKLATSQFSVAWKGDWKGKTVIINKVTTETVTSLDLLDKCAFMKTMNHDNLIRFCAVYMSSEPFLVVTECMESGNLKEYLPGEGKSLKMAELINISQQVAAAMQYLETKNCIHQDLAAKSVLLKVKVSDEETPSITCKLSIYPHVHKLSEYGAFYDLPAGTVPIRWSSHEAIINNQINIKSNVWSFGIFLWEIVHYCQSYPYPDTSEAGVLEKLKQGYRMPRPLGCPDELYKLMIECWKEDASTRPTFETLHWQLKDFYTTDTFGYSYVEIK